MSKHKWNKHISLKDGVRVQYCPHCNQVKSLNRETPPRAFGKVNKSAGAQLDLKVIPRSKRIAQ